MKYKFPEKLIEATLIKRNNQFTLDAEIDGKIEKIHCPTRGRIGNIDIKNIQGLLSYHDNKKRKTKYTLEAISVSNKEKKDKKWVGINQIASNKYVEFFLENKMLPEMISDYTNIKREVKLGNSKLDFKIDNIYLEVKTPLQTLQIEYDTQIHTKPVNKFSSTERFVKHMTELSNSLEKNQKAILLNTFQYDNPGYKIINKSTNYKTVQKVVNKALTKGVEIWQINMEITPKEIKLIKYWQTTDEFKGVHL